MTEVVRLNDPEWINLLLDQPRLGEMLMACMHVQPDIDPQAGFGAMQAYAMWRQLELPEGLIPAFLAQADNRYKAYLALRAFGLLYAHRDNVISALEVGEPFNYKEMLTYVVGICNLFRADLIKPHINGSKKCQFAKASPKKPSKPATSTGCSLTQSRRKSVRSPKSPSSAKTKK